MQKSLLCDLLFTTTPNLSYFYLFHYIDIFVSYPSGTPTQIQLTVAAIWVIIMPELSCWSQLRTWPLLRFQAAASLYTEVCRRCRSGKGAHDHHIAFIEINLEFVRGGYWTHFVQSALSCPLSFISSSAIWLVSCFIVSSGTVYRSYPFIGANFNLISETRPATQCVLLEINTQEINSLVDTYWC